MTFFEIPPLTQSLCSLQLSSISNTSDFICKSKSSACLLDPVQTVLVKSCLQPPFPFIIAILPSSSISGVVPGLFKTNYHSYIEETQPQQETQSEHNNYT
ncbi:hypothetical protein GOODEAATRI_033190 [Goodea atripinnis]|uniref:Uncharacterized protein n=1 Tax=Goodea atripinnis TaxID=208336 RepID=A0ABV0PUG0_9TELE